MGGMGRQVARPSAADAYPLELLLSRRIPAARTGHGERTRAARPVSHRTSTGLLFTRSRLSRDSKPRSGHRHEPTCHGHARYTQQPVQSPAATLPHYAQHVVFAGVMGDAAMLDAVLALDCREG